MATEIKNNKPIETIRERFGNKATIWLNSSSKGNFYSIELSRTYKTEAGYRDSRSFNDKDLLIIANLATKAHDRIGELKAIEAAAKRGAE